MFQLNFPVVFIVEEDASPKGPRVGVNVPRESVTSDKCLVESQKVVLREGEEAFQWETKIGLNGEHSLVVPFDDWGFKGRRGRA